MAQQGLWQRQCQKCNATFLGVEEFCPHDGSPLLAPRAIAKKDMLLGQIIDDRFVLERVLGQGGMGIVYLARHRMLARSFALKMLRYELVSDEMARRRFQREARAASAVVHPNVVSLYDYGQTADGQSYLVMEYVEGISLHELAGKSPSRQLHITQAVDITMQVVQALTAAHACGIVHRDIKPENILLMHHNGQPDFVKVTDFGVARIIDEQRLTADGSLVGTPEFIAPEMITGADVGPKADLYAVGVMMHELIAGTPPFVGNINAILNSHLNTQPPSLAERCQGKPIPKELDQLVARLLSKSVATRPTAGEVLNILMQVRPRLPPRSIRSLLLMETLVLAGRQAGGAVHSAETLELPPERSDLLQTLELPPLLYEMDQVDIEMERSSQQLFRLVTALIRRRWPQRPPTEIAKQCEHLSACEKAEEEIGMQVALMRDDAEREAQQSEDRRREVQAQMIRLREQMTASVPPSGKEMQRLRDALLDLERAHAATAQEGSAACELSKMRPRMQELRSEIQRSRRELAALVIKRCRTDTKARNDKTALVACQGLEKVAADFDRLCRTMTLLLERLPATSRP